MPQPLLRSANVHAGQRPEGSWLASGSSRPARDPVAISSVGHALAHSLFSGRLELVRDQAAALRDWLHDSVELTTELARNAYSQHLIRRQGHLVVYRSRQAFDADAMGWQLRRDNGIDFSIHERSAERRLVKPWPDQGGCRGSRSRRLFQGAGIATGRRGAAGYRAGHYVIIQAPEAVPRLPIMDAEGKFVATPMEMGLRLAGTFEFVGLSAAPDWRRADKLLALGQRLLPALSPEYGERASYAVDGSATAHARLPPRDWPIPF